MDYYNSVKIFHEVFKHPAPAFVTLSPYGNAEKDEKLRNLRIALLVEEIGELEDAIAAHDVIEIADAAGDIIYVAIGALICFGLSDNAYHAATFGPGEARYRDVVANFVQPIKDQLAVFTKAIAANQIGLVKTSLAELSRAALRAAESCRIDMDLVFAEIQRSNMSKLDQNGQPILREDGKILKSNLFSEPDIAKVLSIQPKVA